MVLKMPSYKMIMMIASVVLLILSLVLIVIPSVRQKVIELEGLKTIKREDFVKQVRNRYVSDKFNNAIARYLDDAYKYSRVYQKDPTRTSFDFFRNTVLMGGIAFVIFGLLTQINKIYCMEQIKNVFIYHVILSLQKSLRLHLAQWVPCQTLSRWSAAASTKEGSSVRIPASKLRLPSPFMPMPAPVRLAEPI